MRPVIRILMVLLCLVLALPAVGAAENDATASYLAALEIQAGETLIPPAQPVPDYVLWLVDVARGELGYTEERSGVTKYGTWAGYPTAEWCAEFACWCVNRVDQLHQTHLLTRLYPNYSGTNVGRDWFLTQGRYIARKGTVPGWGTQWFKGETTAMTPNSYIPQPGDWLFLSVNSTGDTAHVALVEYCAYDDHGQARVHVIEGNNTSKPAPQSVERNDYALDYWAIQGYGTVHDLVEITLRFGCDGEKVLALQRKLVAAGLLESQYTTGRYGAITTDAIKDFQQKTGILETGVANLETQLALENELDRINR
ncbi:MAG: peptidoglycan-binding protein [Clostridia bacterium]|nr:peptidoglycan-binding protein [Clostridia bacterium]